MQILRCASACLLPLLLLLPLYGCGGSDANPTTPTASPAATKPPALEVEPLATAAGSRLVGSAVQASLLRSDPTYASVFARHFNYVTAEYEMKWGQIERQQGQRNYGPGDEIVAFAESHSMRVKGHALIWHGDSPAWLESLSPAEARIAFEDQIRITVGHYRGHVAAWDVVNEAIADGQAGLRDTVYVRKLGPNFIADAFRLSRAADPDALLIYNDYGGEGLNRKSDDIYALVSDLVRQGVPIGGVGLQMHLDAVSRPSTADIATNVRRLAALGLLVNFSEMDVRVARVSGDTTAKLEEQRRTYHDVIGVCVAEPRCHAITLWGFTDLHTWIDAAFGADDPLPFDESYRAKPAYTGMLEALKGR